MEEDLDVAGTQRVVNRAMISSVLAFFGAFGAYASSFVLSPVVSAVFVLIVLGVAISAIRTLVHPDAVYVAGNIRWLGIGLSGISILLSLVDLLSFAVRLAGAVS